MWARRLIVLVVLTAAFAADAASQDRPTTALAKELTAFMKQRGLESVAAHLGPSEQ